MRMVCEGRYESSLNYAKEGKLFLSRSKKKKEYDFWLPHDEMEELARTLLPAIRAFYETEEGQKEFEQWKVKQAKQ